MSYGGANKGGGGQKRGGNRGQDNDEDDYQEDSYGGKKKSEITYRPREGDEDDDGNQDYERSSRTKNVRNAADDEAQETEEMR